MGHSVSNSNEQEDAFFRGTVTRITFHNEETGFGVMRAEAETTGPTGSSFVNSTQTTVVGVLPPDIRNGANIVARGSWQTHPKFGRQFKAYSVTETRPTGKEAIQRYLASGAVKGFGPVLAERIVDVFGEQALEIIDNSPERLIEVPGIGEKKLSEISQAWGKKKNLREVLLFFQNHNVSLALAHRIYNVYHDRAIEMVSQNPYVLARDVWGIGFLTADSIASAIGIAPNAPQRIIAGISYTLKRAADDGHCFLPDDYLLTKAASLLKIEDEETMRSGLEQAIAAADLKRDGERIYLPYLYFAEDQLANILAARLLDTSNVRASIPEALVEETCKIQDRGLALSSQQLEAIRLAAEKNILVITGGPGCGKTTVTKTIATLFRRASLSVQLAAPTGRAAQRLGEVCGMKASTIHRLLKFEPIKRTFLHDKDTPLVGDAFIVDESSMIDLQLAASLLQALPTNARLIIVGDADQLPSVGPGLFLADLLSIPQIPRVRLTTLFRRSDESHITQFAYEINSGIVPEIPEPDGQTKSDAYFLKAEEQAEAAQLVERLVVDQIPKRFGLKGSDITVLTPMNQGDIGVVALNERLQKHLVPVREGLARIVVGNLEFRLGDRVCQRVNNYQITANGVFNGDQGEVVGIDSEERTMTIKLWDGREVVYSADDIYQLDLAYALTIHRSQGSEVPAVVLVLHESHSLLLERQLLYTAVTRAKKLLIIVGTKRALQIATKRSRSKRRYTALTERTVAKLG